MVSEKPTDMNNDNKLINPVTIIKSTLPMSYYPPSLERVHWLLNNKTRRTGDKLNSS
jgi:hypothetical protein